MEFLIILSVTLLALLVFMSLSQSESADVGLEKERTDAYNSVRTLGAAADEVYSQGAGARKKVDIEIPAGFVRNESFISKNAIKMRAAGNDYIEIKDFEVFGSFPSSSGPTQIWVESVGDRVKIGNAIIEVDRESINLIMGHDDSRTETFSVTNLINSSLLVKISADWNHENISMGMASDSFVLPSYGADVSTLSFKSSKSVYTGFYSGSLNVTAYDSLSAQSVSVPITVEIARTMIPEGGPPLVVVPSIFNATLRQGQSTTKTFQVCTNSETTLETIEFSSSENWPGSWVSQMEPLSRQEPSVCQAKTLRLDIPVDAAADTWRGYVYVKGDLEEAEDVIVLDINVMNVINRSDNIGPEVTEIVVYPSMRNIFVGDPVSIKVSANDSAYGNNSIVSCEVKIDNIGGYNSIPALDGIYNEVAEDAGIRYANGFDHGLHEVRARCIDANGNVGDFKSKEFIILKEFLFITGNSTPNTDEQAWIDWINSGRSFEGLSWSMDRADSASLMNGSANPQYYSTIILEEFVLGMESSLNSLNSSVVLLGHALQNGTKALGLSNDTTVPGDWNNLNFIDQEHYILNNVSGKNKVTDSTIFFGRFQSFDGNVLISGPGTPAGVHAMGVSDNIYLWGATNPTNLNELGVNVTTRMLDHAVMGGDGS
jgi:hypothetical protein